MNDESLYKEKDVLTEYIMSYSTKYFSWEEIPAGSLISPTQCRATLQQVVSLSQIMKMEILQHLWAAILCLSEQEIP